MIKAQLNFVIVSSTLPRMIFEEFKKVILDSSVTRMTSVELKYITISNTVSRITVVEKTKSLFIRRIGIYIISHNNYKLINI
jgi:hypothetical protein